jgi:hypothetical protein
MEQQEEEALIHHLNRKEAQRNKKKVWLQCHQKIVSRQMAKDYMSNLKQNSFKYFSDVSYFHDKRISRIQTDVLSWLLDNAENFVSELE